MVIFPGRQKPNYVTGQDCCLPQPQTQETRPPNRGTEVTNVQRCLQRQLITVCARKQRIFYLRLTSQCVTYK